jgi:putative phosphoribosyl transferase
VHTAACTTEEATVPPAPPSHQTFLDRTDAGRRLAGRLALFAVEDPVIIALPRGGVPVAAEVAVVLDAPLDILGVRKLGAPGNPELAVGAIAEGDVGVLDEDTRAALGISHERLQNTISRERRELDRRVLAYREDRPRIDLTGRTVIVVDDGLATGLTDVAAVRALRAQGARRIVVAAPVASPQAVAVLTREADEVVCVTVPDRMMAVGAWYEDFSPVSDEEVLALLAAAAASPAARAPSAVIRHEVRFPVGTGSVVGDLALPHGAGGIVVFAHGSGSSRHSPRNQAVAAALVERGLGTILIDLLTHHEAAHRANVFDIALLGSRLESVARWVQAEPELAHLPLGFFGASTGAAAALWAAAEMGEDIRAVVSRGGRPDLAEDRLPLVRAPTLLIVGGHDPEVLDLNRQAAARLRAPHDVAVVPGATHLFEEPGTLEAVTALAGDWFSTHLVATPAQA